MDVGKGTVPSLCMRRDEAGIALLLQMCLGENRS